MVHMVASPSTIGSGVDWAASQIPNQYTGPDRVAAILADLGKPAAAEYLEGKLPISKRTRSGDLGEIIGAQYAALELGFRVVERLRWKDHREMSMRGDDLVGVRAATNGSLELLKGEAKSRATLGSATVTDADLALRRDRGRPLPHALSFVADRLHELGEHALANLVDDAQLTTGISQRPHPSNQSSPEDLTRANGASTVSSPQPPTTSAVTPRGHTRCFRQRSIPVKSRLASDPSSTSSAENSTPWTRSS